MVADTVRERLQNVKLAIIFLRQAGILGWNFLYFNGLLTQLNSVQDRTLPPKHRQFLFSKFTVTVLNSNNVGTHFSKDQFIFNIDLGNINNIF